MKFLGTCAFLLGIRGIVVGYGLMGTELVEDIINKTA
jgi:hypothetical protein